MAIADYRLCDICGRKAFYDSNLNYRMKPFSDGQKAVLDGVFYLDSLGDWKVLCADCSMTHRCVIEKIPTNRR